MKNKIIYLLLNNYRDKFITAKELLSIVNIADDGVTFKGDFNRYLADLKDEYNNQMFEKYEQRKVSPDNFILITSSSNGYCSTNDPEVQENYVKFYVSRAYPILTNGYRMKKILESIHNRKIQFQLPIVEEYQGGLF